MNKEELKKLIDKHKNIGLISKELNINWRFILGKVHKLDL